MYRERGGGSSKSEIVGGPLDRKRINDALDKHLEKSSPSTSKGLSSKDKERLSVPSTSAGKSQLDHRDTRAASLPKNKCSDGQCFFFFFFFFPTILLFECDKGWFLWWIVDVMFGFGWFCGVPRCRGVNLWYGIWVYLFFAAFCFFLLYPNPERVKGKRRRKKESLYLFDCAYFLNVNFYMDSWNCVLWLRWKIRYTLWRCVGYWRETGGKGLAKTAKGFLDMLV